MVSTAQGAGPAHVPRRGGASPLDRRDLLLPERLDDVRLAEVAEAVEQDAAFGTGGNLADLLLDAPQRGDLALPQHPVPALDARRVAAQDLAVRHQTASRRPALADREDLADLGVAVHDLPEARPEHPDQRPADVLDHVVDDRVVPHVDVLGLGGAAGTRLGSHIERYDDRLG